MHSTEHRMTRRQLLHMTGSRRPGRGVGCQDHHPRPRQRPAKDVEDLAMDSLRARLRHLVQRHGYVKEWGEKNNTTVMVENVGVGDILHRAAEESKAQHGHDLFAHVNPIASHTKTGKSVTATSMRKV